MSNWFQNFFFTFLLFFSNALLACPNCAGSGSEKDNNTVLIIGIFIVLSYIPFYLIFRLIRKYRHISSSEE